MHQENHCAYYSQNSAFMCYIIPDECYSMVVKSLEKQRNSISILEPEIRSEFKEIYQKYIDTSLLDFKQTITKHLQEKTKIRPITEILVSPRILSDRNWRVLDETQWSIINENIPNYQYKIPIIFQKQTQTSCYFQQQFTKISIIFQSSFINKAFQGFIPKNTPLQIVVSILGQQLGFYGYEQASYLIIQSQCLLDYTNLGAFSASDLYQKQLIITNLSVQVDNNSSMDPEYSEHAKWEQFLESSNHQAQSASTGIDVEMMGDLNNRIRIFSAKEDQQINDMKKRSIQIIQGPKIPLPRANQQQMNISLQQIAKQSLGYHWF